MTCVSLCSMRVMWNGKLSKTFNPLRGVHLGDLISPYLCVLCIKRLAHYISYAIRARLCKLVFPKKSGSPISHLFFIDDLILFADTLVDQVKVINACLEVFCSTSG